MTTAEAARISAGHEALARIPAFPPVATRLMQLLSNEEEVDVAAVAKLLRADAAFSAEILHQANSARYGLVSQIHALPHAVTVLGISRVKALSVTVAAGTYLRSSLRVTELRRCWRHTLACAIVSQELARTCNFQQDEAYTAGLLHDIGRLGLLVAHPERYTGLLRLVDRNALDVLETEVAEFGIDHCAAGRWLSERWKLPQDLWVIAGRHHDPLGGDSFGLLELVHIGCRMADALGYAVIPAARVAGFDELRQLLPERFRDKLANAENGLRSLVDRELGYHDPDAAHAGPAKPAHNPGIESDEPEPERQPGLAGPTEGSVLGQALMIAIVTGMTTALALLLLRHFFGE